MDNGDVVNLLNEQINKVTVSNFVHSMYYLFDETSDSSSRSLENPTRAILNSQNESQKQSFLKNLLLCVQDQIDDFKKKHAMVIDVNYYNLVINNIKDTYHTLFSNIIQNIERTKQNIKITYDDPSQIFVYNIPHDLSIMYITMVGAGGAGGIGFIRDGNTYISGGGGGGGACLTQKPVRICRDTILEIKVGQGGSMNTIPDGSDTYVKITYPDNTNLTVTCEGGKMGHPSLLFENNINGGIGGKCSEYAPTKVFKSNLFDIKLGDGNSNNANVASFDINSDELLFSSSDGKNGDNGAISYPSQEIARGGNGGNSLFCNGGRGGGFNINIGDNLNLNQDDFLGGDGKLGSGGGGSIPRSNIDTTKKCSGNGGNGCVFIHFC